VLLLLSGFKTQNCLRFDHAFGKAENRKINYRQLAVSDKGAINHDFKLRRGEEREIQTKLAANFIVLKLFDWESIYYWELITYL
jgi:hypothetical protein